MKLYTKYCIDHHFTEDRESFSNVIKVHPEEKWTLTLNNSHNCSSTDTIATNVVGTGGVSRRSGGASEFLESGHRLYDSGWNKQQQQKHNETYGIGSVLQWLGSGWVSTRSFLSSFQRTLLAFLGVPMSVSIPFPFLFFITFLRTSSSVQLHTMGTINRRWPPENLVRE